MTSLYDSLKAEFCPPLDTSLLAALLADLDSSSDVNVLRVTLKELASQATAHYDDELANELDSVLCLTTDGSNADFCGESTATSTTSDSSALSHLSFSSPLGFLQAALPHIPPSRLECALSDAATREGSSVDMESVIDALLTDEFIRELEERGLDAINDDDSPLPSESSWKRVESKKRVSPAIGKPSKKKSNRGKTIALVDIRQRQNLPPPVVRAATADPWTQLTSLCEHLAMLLPPHPAAFFQSHFHSPSYASPAKALRGALSSIACTQKNSSFDTTATLFAMLDVLRDTPMCASFDAEQSSALYTDAQLALRAASGRGDDAIDIVWLLLDLDLDHESGALAMGIYHHPPKSPLSPNRSSAWPSPTSALPPTGRDQNSSVRSGMRPLLGGPPPTQPPSTSKRKGGSSAGTSPTTTSPNQFEWKTVPSKPPKGPHPLALHIPTYGTSNTSNQSRRSAGPGKVRGTGMIGRGSKSEAGELIRPDLKQRMAANLKKRNELLKEASKAWSRGNAKSRGGEVALYFAERAREFHELARREELNQARIMVESKRSADRCTVDLHGTSISEAIVIVKEILEDEGCSPANPLKIITGRGTHSVNGVGVLKPAVRNALVREGWNVGVWDGGLVVRGRN